MTILLGAIADDFTGATDLANTLTKKGMRVAQIIGVPDKTTEVGNAQAVVVALKSRTAPVAEAVHQSIATLHWLVTNGAQQIISKYCSTFDSTANGNIGPIADALIAELQSDFALVCPAFPENGRTIYQGHLFVGSELLSESPMKDHPLTPMRNANLLDLMSAQSQNDVGLIPLQIVRTGAQAIRRHIGMLKDAGYKYGVIDAISDDDLRTIGRAASDHKLVTGGSGIAIELPDNFIRQGKMSKATPNNFSQVPGREVVIAGSCSMATRAQIAAVKSIWPSLKINVEEIVENDDLISTISNWALAQPDDTPILIYASEDPEKVALSQEKYGITVAGEMIETALAAIATNLTGNGFNKLIVAGGETSGAVVSALQVDTLLIGQEIAPGVPWTITIGEFPLALALKSGNFGHENFFKEAFAVLS